MGDTQNATPNAGRVKRWLGTLLKMLVVGGAFAFLLIDWSKPPLVKADILRPAIIAAQLAKPSSVPMSTPTPKPSLVVSPSSSPAKAIPPSAYLRLRESLSEKTRTAIDAAISTPTEFVDSSLLCAEFNALIAKDVFLPPELIRRLPFSAAGQATVDEFLNTSEANRAGQTASLNRLLLDTLFPRAIRKRSGPKLSLGILRVSPEKYYYVAVGALFLLVAMVTTMFRYWIMLRGVKIFLPLREVVRICFIGAFFNTFMLGALGGDVIKIAYVMRESKNRAGALASALLDRVVGLSGLILLGGIALFFSWSEVARTPSMYPIALAIFGVLGAMVFIGVVSLIALARGRLTALLAWGILSAALAALTWGILSGQGIVFPQAGSLRPLSLEQLRGWGILIMSIDSLVALPCLMVVPSCQPGRRLAEFMETKVPLGGGVIALVQALLAYRSHFSGLLLAFILTLILQTFALFGLYCFGQALTLETPPVLSQLFFAAPPAFVTAALPIPGGGVGVGEAALEEILALCRNENGAPVLGGAAIFLMNRCWTILLGLIGLVFYLRGKKEIESARADYIKGETGKFQATKPNEG